MQITDEQFATQLAAFPPHLPEGFVQYAPYGIMLRGSFNHVQVCPIVMGFDKPRQYIVEVTNMGCRVALDSEGRLHEGKFGYKVVNPPTFVEFDDAVQAARDFMESTEPRVYARINGERVL